MALRLILANKAYSSWSFRPWIAMRHFAVIFDEVVIPLDRPETRRDILAYAPTGKCPCLIDGTTTVWDSLAIIEYVAELFPTLAIWPKDPAARALARSLSAEMHSGFMPLRGHLPMNMRRPVKKRVLTPEVEADVARIEQAFAAARATFGAGSDFLCGGFSAVDAMFAPIVNRFHVYDVPVSIETRTYMDAMMDLAAWRDWQRDAEAETERIARYEAI